MAKAVDGRNVVIAYCDPFANQPKHIREIVARKLVQAVRYDKTEGRMLACVEPEGFDGVDPSERLSKEVSDTLGTPYRVSIERNVCRRAYDITIRCLSCRQFHTSDIGEDELETDPGFFEGRTDIVVQGILNRRQAAVIDERRSCFCVDGLPPSMCVARFQGGQLLNDHRPSKANDVRVRLTDAQRVLARRMWSAALRTKQAEAREKERCQVLVDIQEIE